MAPRKFLYDERTRLVVPLTSSQDRLREIRQSTLPPLTTSQTATIQERMANDPVGAARARQSAEQVLLTAQLTSMSAIGLPASDHVTSLWHEYSQRALLHGNDLMPSSFNVGEMFVRFLPQLQYWELLEQKEYLLHSNDFFDWFDTASDLSSVGLLAEILQEEVIHSYSFVNDHQAPQLSAGRASISLAGISLVQRADEIGVILLAGEDPPIDTNNLEPTNNRPFNGKESIQANEDFSSDDRLLPWLPGLGRLFLMTTLRTSDLTHGPLYAFRDIGNGYQMFSDVVEDLADGVIPSQSIESNHRSLEEFSEVFSTLFSLAFLPVMMVDRREHLQREQFTTHLATEWNSREVRKLRKKLGSDSLPKFRDVYCLRPSGTNRQATVLKPPPFEFDTSGFWKTIGANQIGVDKDGGAVVGKTWVERSDSSKFVEPAEFILRLGSPATPGPDPGVVYIVRSDSHLNDVYKVGLTRRSASERAAELSSNTSTPLPFAVLASWDVGDCTAIENETHELLDPYRINKRREFFKCPLEHIVRTIDSLIKDFEVTKKPD